jgi:hypothetical protein
LLIVQVFYLVQDQVKFFYPPHQHPTTDPQEIYSKGKTISAYSFNRHSFTYKFDFEKHDGFQWSQYTSLHLFQYHHVRYVLF